MTVVLGNPAPAQGGFPWGTLLVNLLGCLLVGLLAGWLEGRDVLREEVRLALVVGVLGGFTTFSSFALEALQLLSHRGAGLAAAYVLASVAGGMAMAGAGLLYMRPTG